MGKEGTDSKAGGTPESKAFAVFYEQHLTSVFQYVYYRIGDRAAAEDLTSDIFSKALTGFPKYNPEKAAFSTWIFSIARNTLTDYYRKIGRERRQRSSETDLSSVSISDSPEDKAIRAEESSRLRRCLSLLKPVEQELISLKFGSGITNREIARIIGLSESNVGTVLCRAMRKLRVSLSED